MKPKLTLRDLFWLVTLCAVALAIWQQIGAERDRLRSAIHSAGYAIGKNDDGGYRLVDRRLP